jgi:hypothetical protein
MRLSRTDEYLANADNCLVLADRFSGSASEQSFRAAAAAWLMLAELEARQTANPLAPDRKPAHAWKPRGAVQPGPAAGGSYSNPGSRAGFPPPPPNR